MLGSCSQLLLYIWQFCSGKGHVKTSPYNILQRLKVKSLFECYYIISKHFHQDIEIYMSLITITLLLSIYLGITKLQQTREQIENRLYIINRLNKFSWTSWCYNMHENSTTAARKIDTWQLWRKAWILANTVFSDLIPISEKPLHRCCTEHKRKPNQTRIEDN